MNEAIYTGSILTGSEIKKQIELGNIEIDPYDESCINPNSYNVKLHPQLAIYNRDRSKENNNLKLNLMQLLRNIMIEIFHILSLLLKLKILLLNMIR